MTIKSTPINKCISCNRDDILISLRTLHDGDKKYLCQQCYTKTLPICSSCSYRRKAYSYTLKKKPLCKICALENMRQCKICKQDFPAGQGRICFNCHLESLLHKKIIDLSSKLPQNIIQYFHEFAQWLKIRRELNYTAVYLGKYHEYFFQLGTLSSYFQRFPTYKEILENYPFATSKKYLLVHTFLSEKNLIKIDKELKEFYANKALIDTMLKSFENTTNNFFMIHQYYKKLDKKFQNQKISFRSIRLALTASVKFLQYCENFKDKHPSKESLEGYLWVFPGQRSALTEFINFISIKYSYNLKITDIPKASLSRPKISRQILKNRFIKIMQNPNDRYLKLQFFFKVIIGYFHWVNVPNNVYISIEHFKKDKNRKFYLQLCSQKFYIPADVVSFIIQHQKNHKD